jgi:uncharacterized protein (DUF2267 family)
MNANEMLRTLAGATGSTRRQADDVLIATLTVLSEVVSADETRDLLAQLPKSVRERVPVSGTVLPMRPIEFVARVADLTVSTADDAERNVRAVFEVLTDAVNAGEMNDIAAELGDDFAALLGREERVRREHERAAATATPSASPGLVPSLVGAAVSSVHSLVRAAWRPIDAGLRLGGMRH